MSERIDNQLSDIKNISQIISIQTFSEQQCLFGEEKTSL